MTSSVPLPPWAVETVELVPYDPGWPERAAAFGREVTSALAPWLLRPVEHIGSTAIPGILAKPVIDLMAETESKREAAAGAGPALGRLGWEPVPPEADERPWRLLFVRVSGDGRHRLAHLHLMSAGTPRWAEQFRFRDALRESTRLRDDYARLKTGLAREFAGDREGYSRAKAGFVSQVISGL